MKLESTVIRHPAVLLHMGPLLDLVLILMVFFLLGSHFVQQFGVAVQLPFSPSVVPPITDPHIITVSSGATPQIFFNERKVDLPTLARFLEAEKSGRKTVVLRADDDTPYGIVMKISVLAQRNGYELIQATRPQG